MSAFRAVNTAIAGGDLPPGQSEEATPTTPKPFPVEPFAAQAKDEDMAAKTPTRDSFAGIIGQKPLPELPAIQPKPSDRPDSKMGADDDKIETTEEHNASDSQNADVEMTDSPDGKEGSPQSVEERDESGKPSKKKKGQRFFCTDWPPCELSFTRSEHLARHIRYV